MVSRVSQKPVRVLGPMELTGWLATLTLIREGLESLTVTGPSPILNKMYQEALKVVLARPSLQEREAALSRAWLASSRAAQLLQEGNRAAAMRAADEMYGQVRAAISASRLT
jgi:hypothetical protein